MTVIRESDMKIITEHQYNHLCKDYQAQPEWIINLSYAILSLQVNDEQQFSLSSDYYQGGEFVDDIYVKALLKGGVLESEELTEEGKLYMSDLNIKEYRHMQKNEEPYTSFLWNTELFRDNFSLWSWIVWPDIDYETYRENSEGV
jgi:hypothetical protein